MISLIPLFLAFYISNHNPINNVEDYIANDMEYLVSLYKHIHKHPEISLQEKETAGLLTEELRKIGFDVTENFGGYGIVGILKNGEGPQILYRTDMDALPMYEKTNLDYASAVTAEFNGQEVGTMHSCGHDMHMATWLGTARAMVAMKDQWQGTLMLIGQPAEEIGAGAKMMLDAGLYGQFGIPDFGIGLHCNPTLRAGQVGISPGYTMANTESIDILVKGVGAHGASPHQSIDPVVLASMIVMDIQTIVSRNIKPIDDAVITVGAIKGGTKHNIIPDEVTLQLTVRTFKEDVRLLIHKRLEEIARGVAIAAGMPEDLMPEITIPDDFTPSNYNDPGLTQYFKNSASKAISTDNVVDTEPQMVGEDFSWFGRTEHDVPTILYWLGTVSEEKIEKGDLPGLHSPFYYPEPEESLSAGISVNTRVLIDLFSQKE